MIILILIYIYGQLQQNVMSQISSNGISSYDLMFVRDGYPKPGDIPMLNRKIFRGQRVYIREHPYIASVRRRYTHYSTAAILTKNLFLTVAHNLIDVPISELNVVVGENYADRGTVMLTVVLLIVHEEFDPYTLLADIALVRIYEDITYRGSVKPIGLVAPTDHVKDGRAFVTGWGRCDTTERELCLPRSTRFFPDEKLDPMLRSVSFHITWPNFYCDSYIRHGIDLKRGMLCVGTAREEEPVCPCLAVPGAPLVFRSRLAGLQSWGFGCGFHHDLPLIYTDVRAYQPWLIHNIPILRSIKRSNLTKIFKATRAHVLLQWLSQTRLIVPKLRKQVDRDLIPTSLDKVLTQLKGTVYDIRDFIENEAYRYKKALMFDSIRQHDNMIRTLKSQKGLEKGQPFISNITMKDLYENEIVKTNLRGNIAAERDTPLPVTEDLTNNVKLT